MQEFCSFVKYLQKSIVKFFTGEHATRQFPDTKHVNYSSARACGINYIVRPTAPQPAAEDC